MRVSEDRYARDLRRIQLAHRLIRHEVRTYWICAFTQQTSDRVRNLLRSYGDEVTRRRHRGAPPHNHSRLLLPALHGEASALAGIVLLWRLIPPERVPNARRTLPCLELGERLCKAFELFGFIVPGTVMSMDQLMLLTIALAERQLTLGHCRECNAAILLDPLDVPRELCLYCHRDRSVSLPSRERETNPLATVGPMDPPGEAWSEKQQSLF